MSPTPACDCGALAARTTHSGWCSSAICKDVEAARVSVPGITKEQAEQLKSDYLKSFPEMASWISTGEQRIKDERVITRMLDGFERARLRGRSVTDFRTIAEMILIGIREAKAGGLL